MIFKDIFPVIALVLIFQQVADGKISSIQSLNKAAIDKNSNNYNGPSIDKIYHDSNTASMEGNLQNTNSALIDGNYDINEASINNNYNKFNEDSRGEVVNRASIDETHEINAASVDGNYNINLASIDGNYNMNEDSLGESHEINAEIDGSYSDEVSLDRDYPSINEDVDSLGESHEINAASIDEDYNHLNSLISSSLNDDQFEEKRTIDITKKLKDLGNRITSFFIGDNNYEESYNSFTEATSSPSVENGKHLNEEMINEDNRGSIGKNFTEVSKQQNLSELSKKLAAPDERIEVKLDNKKLINDAEIRRGNQHFEERNYHKQDKFVPTRSFQVDSEELQDAYINAMPLLKQYLTMLSKTEAPNNIYRSNSNPQLRLQEHPGLKRIQGFLKSTNSQLMNGPFPGFRGDSQLLDKFGKKLKGLRYNVK